MNKGPEEGEDESRVIKTEVASVLHHASSIAHLFDPRFFAQSAYTVTSAPSRPDRYAAMIRSSTTDPSTSVWIGRSPVVTQCTK